MTDRMRRMLVLVDGVIEAAREVGDRRHAEYSTAREHMKALDVERRQLARLERALETWERQIERARAAHKRVLFRRGRKAA